MLDDRGPKWRVVRLSIGSFIDFSYNFTIASTAKKIYHLQHSFAHMYPLVTHCRGSDQGNDG